MKHTISLASLLTVFWLLNSGHYTLLLLLLGALSIALVVVIAHRMDIVDHESQPLHLTLRTPGYWLWLAKEIIVANFDVVYRIWRGNSSISPAQGKLKASQQTIIGKVVYANSITLTPGTVAIDLEGDTVTVHALTQKAMTGLRSGYMDRRISKLGW